MSLYQMVANNFFLFSYAAAAAAKSLQSCPTLCDPLDGSPPGSAIPGILQARTLEWACFHIDSMKCKRDELYCFSDTFNIYGPHLT